MLPELNSIGLLPVGVHKSKLSDVEARFGVSSPRRIWLFSRLTMILALAASTGQLKRVYIWGSFVTAKEAPGDLDLLLLMDEAFTTEALGPEVLVVFDSSRAKLHFAADVFWARVSIGPAVLDAWLETYQTSRDYRKRGIVELEFA